MPIFEYFQDVKCTVWERKFFNVEAATDAEADEIARQCVNEHIDMCAAEEVTHLEEDETLYETMDLIPLEENRGSATIEIFRRESRCNGPLLADNSPANNSSHE